MIDAFVHTAKPKKMKHTLLLTALVAANQLLAQTFNKVVYNSDNSGLPHNTIRCIAIDTNDNVWIGTQQGGVARFDGEDWSVWNTANSNLPGNNVRVVQPLENGEVWISTIISTSTIPYRISKLYENNVTNWSGVTNGYDIVEAFDYYDNKVWISTFNGMYTYENNSFSPFNTGDGCIPSTFVSDILFVSPDKYWVAASNYDGSGMAGLLQIEQDICTVYNNSNSGFPSNNTTADLKKDKDNPDKVWLRTNAGVTSFDGTAWEVFAAPGTSLPNSFAIDSFGDIWVAYIFHGLQKYDGAWHYYQNLVNDGINALAIDSHNNLWIGTENSGLIKLVRVLTSTTGTSAAQSVKCYPTVFREELYLEQDLDRTLSWILMDINGKVAAQEQFTGHKATISLAGYKIPPGAYFYCIKNANNDIIQTGKLLKTE